MVSAMSESAHLHNIYTKITCSRFRCFCVIVVAAIFILLLTINSFGSSLSLLVEPDSSAVHRKLMSDSSVQNGRSEHLSSDEDSSQESNFVYDPSNDVLVFLHMQKTSGSVFGRHLVRNAVGFPASCYRVHGRKRRNCTGSDGYQWLFSRFSTGWACGLHADWTELRACVPRTLNKMERVRRRRRYVYITFLRDPVFRYLSEFKHVERGATWKNAKLKCNGRSAAGSIVPLCYRGENWEGVSLDEFMDCPFNLANNRQTRMLADLTLVGCYNRSAFADPGERDRIMLQSAKDNLRSMVFFGLTERQVDSQHLFEHTFKIRFTEDFVQRNSTNADRVSVSDDQIHMIESRNSLDIRLYRYALQLFNERVQQLRTAEDQHAVYSEASDQRQISSRSRWGRRRLMNSAKN